PEAGLFDPRGAINFPPRVEVLGSVHGNQIFGYAHAGLTARVQVTPHNVRGIQGFLTALPSGSSIFLAPRKTSVLADTTGTLVVDDFSNADELFEAGRQVDAAWSAPKPVNPAKETLEDSERRSEVIVGAWDGKFKFTQEDPDRGKSGLRRPQIGALYAV